MTAPFVLFDEKTRERFLNRRGGETKLGEQLTLIPSLGKVSQSAARYVLFGVPEDIGIRANYGKPGARETWEAFLKAFLNIQINQYNKAGQCAVLGHVDCKNHSREAETILKNKPNPQEELGKLVEEIDTIVATVVRSIITAGKIPIIIGGGHNNSYGNIKGASLALEKPINVLNIDAHTDLRRTDYRHSGNGFSYARKEGYLQNYTLFGIHKNYTPQYIFDEYKESKEVKIRFYEEVMAGSLARQQQELQQSIQDLEGEFGLELDTDAIAGFHSSAQTPSGFSIAGIRHFIRFLKHQKILYFHIAEAADTGDGQIGKALSYFVSDFVR